MRVAFIFAAFAAFVVSNQHVRAEEPFLHPHDVIALVGGEDMVVASELGLLETLLQRALPCYQFKVRSLAWEGDTVFEQHRDLNYPTLEQQLEKIGATVVIAQFGQMESLAGKAHLAEFAEAYEKMIARLDSGGKRRLVLIAPTVFEKGKSSYSRPPDSSPLRSFAQPEPNLVLGEYRMQIGSIAKAHGFPFVNGTRTKAELLEQGRGIDGDFGSGWPPSITGWRAPITTRDGVHADIRGHGVLVMYFRQAFPELRAALLYQPNDDDGRIVRSEHYEELRQLIIAKNRLWFHYTRPQNWAFLAGDRTNQPSSRDDKDPNKRWFPEELERFVPLIEAKEQAIWAAAAKLK